MTHPTPETRTKREMRKMRAMSSTTPWSTLFGLATMFATATAATGCLDLIGYRDHVVGDPFGTGGEGGETGGGGTGGIGGTGGTGGTMCEPGTSMACYSGPPGTETAGICQPGQQTCNDEGSGFGECVGEVLPAVETCGTKVDDDCDGSDCAIWSKVLAANTGLSDVAVDSGGNVVLAGIFSTTMSMGSFLLEAGINGSFFVAKLGPLGDVLWAKAYGDAQTTPWSIGVAVGADGGVVLTGTFDGSLALGGDLLVGEGDGDIFVTKLEPDGAHLWSSRHGDAASQSIRHVAVDSLGDIFLVGSFSGDVSFGGTGVSGGTSDVFVAKLAGATGVAAWAKTMDPNTAPDLVGEVVLDPDDDLIVVGEASGGTVLPVVKLSGLDGSPIWNKSFAGGPKSKLPAVAADSEGNVVIGGRIVESVDLGGGALAAAGNSDMFLARLAKDDGGHLWSKRFGSAGSESLGALAVGSDGLIALVGVSNSAVDFGGGPLTTAGESDVVVAKLDLAGEHVWSRGFGDASAQGFPMINAGIGGVTVVSCQVAGSIDFGNGPLVGGDVGSEQIAIATLVP